MSASSSGNLSRRVETTINYVVPRGEPIYSYDFIEPPPGTPATNVVLEPRAVSIANIREMQQPPSLDAEGFMIASFTTKVRDIYDTDEIDATYNPEIAEFVKRLLGAREVRVFMPFLRGPEAQRRSPGSITAPAGSAHVDYTHETGPEFFDKILGADAEKFRGSNYALINVWRPITGPLRDHPLAVCDARTVSPADLVTSRSITRVNEEGLHTDHGELREYVTYSATWNPAHRWYYTADMMPNEVLLLKNYDSKMDVARFVPHSAFADPSMPADALPRASIEVRTLVIW